MDPWVGKIPRRREGQPTPSILAWRIPMDRGSWWATVREGHKELDTPDQQNTNKKEIKKPMQMPATQESKGTPVRKLKL